MSNKNLFHALSSQTRVNIIKKLVNKEIHLSQLSRELKITKPVISRHIKILEEAGLINRRVIGNVHLLSANFDSLEAAFDPFIEESKIKMEKNSTVLDAIKQIPGVKIETEGKNQWVTSINGEEGFYIYEVNGKIPKQSIDEYKPKDNVTIQLKKLVPVGKKTIKIDFKEKKEKKK